jgi:phosphoheptose isomerase
MHLRTLNELIETLSEFRKSLIDVESAGNVLKSTLLGGSKIMTAGNGGSAADALHLSEEIVGRYKKERSPMSSICLASDPTLITCIGNDYGFDQIFARQIEGIGSPGDVLVVFSTSGNSRNIVESLNAARARKMKSIALLGKDGGAAKHISDAPIIIPSNSTARIQEIHGLIIHMWLDQIEVDL